MAITFAGGTDLISYGAGLSWPQIGCCSLRMKTTQTTANVVPLSIWNSSSRFGFAFILNNASNKLLAHAYGVDGSAVGFSFQSTISVNDGSWHTIALNYDTTSGNPNSYYIDGNLEGSGNSAVTWSIGSGSPPLALGSQPSFWSSYVGDLAEVAVWKSQLDAAEINALAKGFPPNRIRPQSLIFDAPLIRSTNDRRGLSATVTGTTVTDHPRVQFGG